MGTVLKFEKPEPSATKKVCGSCLFYQRSPYNACHASGGRPAYSIWPTCQGKYWQERVPFFRRMLNLFRRS